jgi:hypothetical protein
MEFLKIFWLVIPLGFGAFLTWGDRKDRERAKICFFTFVFVIGAIGFLYTWITTGSIPAPCCN